MDLICFFALAYTHIFVLAYTHKMISLFLQQGGYTLGFFPGRLKKKE